MFDDDSVRALQAAAESFVHALPQGASDSEVCGVLRELSSVIDRLEGAAACWFDELEERRAYEVEGASTAGSWAVRELRWDVRQARSAVASGRTMRVLPRLGAARRAGDVRGPHVQAFTAALRKIDREVIAEAEEVMVEVARTCEPATLREQLQMLAEVAHPDDLDRAWADGMDKHDLKVARVGEGFHVTGFLDPVAGMRFKTWLDAASAPRGEDDQRSPSQRRVDAVGDLAAATLAHGMPTDRGVTPQLQVLVEAAWLSGQVGAAPPVLTGWGPVGDKLFDYLACDGAATDLLVDGLTEGPTPQARVLNVGRTQRFATPKQRKAVHARQGGVCANPGCGGTHLELHHVIWWSNGGPTDLDLLVGLCPRCHQTIHNGRLSVAADGVGGFVFSRVKSRRVIEIEDQQRLRRVQVTQLLGWLRQGVCPHCDNPLGSGSTRVTSRNGDTGVPGRTRLAEGDVAVGAAASPGAAATGGPVVPGGTAATGRPAVPGGTEEDRRYFTLRRFRADDIASAVRSGADLGTLRPYEELLIPLRT